MSDLQRFGLLPSLAYIMNQHISATTEDSLGEFLTNRKYLSRLESELAKPIRRQDSELDYLPTGAFQNYP